ncbi:MAG: hypothetical protein IKY97_02410, partial [Mailhella sp.]|nr:hypothetical protein [Mailhella sp.]
MKLMTIYSKPSMLLFLEMEYKKRQFEYYDSKEAKWLNSHWNDGLREIFEDENDSAIFISYILSILPFLGMIKYIKSDSTKEKHQLAKIAHYLLNKKTDWLKRVLNISLKYGILAPYIIKPVDMISALVTNINKCFIITSTGLFFQINDEDKRTMYINKLFNNSYICPWASFLCRDNILNIKLDINDKQYNFEEAMETIKTILLFYSIKGDNIDELIRSTLGMGDILQKITKEMVIGKMYKNSDNSKLFGLVLWDLKILGQYSRLDEIYKKIGLEQVFNNKSSVVQSAYRDAYHSIKEGKCVSKQEIVPKFLEEPTVCFDRVFNLALSKKPTF